VDAGFANAGNTLTIDGTSGADTIVVEKHPSNNDYLRVLVNSVQEFAGRLSTIGKIVVNGEDGDDTITIASPVSIPATINGGDGTDSLTGGSGNDVIYGGAGGDGIWGGDGNDSLFGEAGNDGLYGQNNNDVLNGGSGTDYISGGSGNDDISAQDGEIDTLDGGSGYDTALVDYDVFTWVFDEDLNIETIYS
jgi:Ca2+-binding RTX toxin-like protein